MATPLSRRQLLRTLGISTVAVPFAAAFGETAFAQGRCMLTLGSPACDTSPIKPLFAPTAWKTIALEQITFSVEEHQKEAAFYRALMGWTFVSDDGTRAIMEVGDWGTVIFKSNPAAPAATGGAGRGGGSRATVESIGFVIDKWDAKSVEAELKKRGLAPVADNGPNGFESFHVKDPDGFDVQLCNGNGLARNRKSTRTISAASVPPPPPFESTGWKTVWLDHFSFSVTNYKESASFYMNLLGWTSTYDEGSQNELLMADVGGIIIRGGNPLDPNFGRGGRGGGAAPGARSARIDHISFGISPWDTDGVKDALEKRGLRARIDTSNRHKDETGAWVPDEIHTAAFKSYHTTTPNGYDLQISYVTKENRLALSNAVRPRKTIP